MTPAERERLCYAEGFTEAAKLLAEIDDLNNTIEKALDLLEKGDTDTAQCVLNEALK